MSILLDPLRGVLRGLVMTPLSSAIAAAGSGGVHRPETLGAELVVNGDFSSATGWTAGGGWSIGSGIASAASSGSLTRGVTVTATRRYMSTYTLVSRSTGTITPSLSGGSTVSGAGQTATGAKRDILTAATGNVTYGYGAAGSPVLSIDNASLKEILVGGYTYALGDSLTFGLVGDLTTAAQFYPALVEAQFPSIKMGNLGVSGDTTSDMVARLSSFANVPYIAIIYGGQNDAGAASTVQAAPAPTATVFSVAAGQGAKHGIGGKILVDGVSAEVLSISTDTLTLTGALPFTPAAGMAVTIDTEANLIKCGEYVQAQGCEKILIVGRHFDNFANGLGDTVAVERGSNATQRIAQQAAATALGAEYIDLYTYMASLITAGTYAQNDNLWHSSANNLHLNALGQSIIAAPMVSKIIQRGWL